MSALGLSDYFDRPPAYTDLTNVLSFDMGARLLRGNWAMRQIRTNRHYRGDDIQAQRREREQTLARRSMERSFAGVELVDTDGLAQLPYWLDELDDYRF